MQNFDMDLIKVRVSAFFHELASIAIVGVLGFLTSDSFQVLVSKHFGATITTSLILLAVNGLVKHLRNLSEIKKYSEEMGAAETTPNNMPARPNLI